MITAEKIAQYREIASYGAHLGLGGKLLNELLDHVEQTDTALTDARFKLANINRICAEAPPCDELDEDGELYDQILNNIQRWTRVTAPSGETGT